MDILQTAEQSAKDMLEEALAGAGIITIRLSLVDLARVCSALTVHVDASRAMARAMIKCGMSKEAHGTEARALRIAEVLAKIEGQLKGTQP